MKTLMKRGLVPSAMLACALMAPSFLHAQQLPIQLTIDGESIPLKLESQGDGKATAWNLAEPMRIGGDNGVYLEQLSMLADPDPYLGYAIGVTDLGTPSTFGFVFGTPIVPTSPPGTITSGFSASLTDGSTGGGVSITPAVPGVPVDGDSVDEIHVVTDGFIQGAGLINDGRDLGPVGTYGTGTSVHGPFNEVGPMPGPGPWTWLQINVTFTGSGGGDFYGLTGSAIKAEGVPEAASTLFLSLLGLAGCAVTRRWAIR